MREAVQGAVYKRGGDWFL
ncbi:hypothetical protein LINPERPRIM_LOCUS12023 [Linum perenne]